MENGKKQNGKALCCTKCNKPAIVEQIRYSIRKKRKRERERQGNGYIEPVSRDPFPDDLGDTSVGQKDRNISTAHH